MLSRRSLFSLFAGVAAVAAGAKVQAEVPIKPVVSMANLPEYNPYGSYPPAHWLTTSELPSHSHTFSGGLVDSGHQHLTFREMRGQMFPRGMTVSGAGMVPSVSDGQGRIVPVESPEGQEILKSTAAPHAGMSRW